jgi:hypothetical protein
VAMRSRVNRPAATPPSMWVRPRRLERKRPGVLSFVEENARGEPNQGRPEKDRRRQRCARSPFLEWDLTPYDASLI